MCILDFFNMKTLLQLLLAQKLIASKCVLFKKNLLPSDTVPLTWCNMFTFRVFHLKVAQRIPATNIPDSPGKNDSVFMAKNAAVYIN